MRKLYLLLAVAASAIAMNAAIESPAGSGIYYDWDSDNILYVNWTDPAVLSGDVVFPATIEIDGYQYNPQYFGQYATQGTWGNANITSVTIEIPAAVPGWMFENCSNMTTLNLGESTTEIGEKAFNGCASLAKVTFSPTLELIGDGSFWGDPITDINIPASVKTIGGYAFGGDTLINNVTFNGIPDSVGPGLFGSEYSQFMVCAPYWNVKSLKTLLDVDHSGLQYKVWDAQIDETWNNPLYLTTCYTDELIVRRNLTANVWNPVVLPVWLSDQQLIDAFGEDVKLVRFTGATTTALNFEPVAFDDATGLEPNTPYLIKPANDVSEVSIPYVWLSDNYDNLAVTVESDVFQGNLDGYERTVPEGALYISAEGELVVSDGTVALAAMSGYFATANASTITQIVIAGEEEVKTGDVNGDGDVDGNDINMLINLLLGKLASDDASVGGNPNVDGQGAIDGSDLNVLINIILGK